MPNRSHSVRAIPTEYAGVGFRSRLEAQWARMMDVLEWRWTYEPDLQAGWVIPDFLVDFPSRPVVIECKPAVTREELEEERHRLILKMPGWLADDVLRELRVLSSDPFADPAETSRALEDLDRVEQGDNPTGHTRRILVVGPQLLGMDGRSTVDGVHGLCLCKHPSRSHIGLSTELGGLCLYCGSEAVEWLPEHLAMGAWRESGAAQQWQPKSRRRHRR